MKRRKLANGSILVLFAIFIAPIPLNSQTPDFFTSTGLPGNLSPGKLQFVQNLTNDSITKQMEYVLFGDLTEVLDNNGVLDLDLPGFGKSFTCNEVHYELKEDEAYNWAEKLSNEAGYIALVKLHGLLTGFIQTDDNFWEIVPLDSTVSILREQKISEFQNEVCGTTSLPDYIPPSEMVAPCSGGNGCSGIIDVLVLIPPDVVTWYDTSAMDFWGALVHFYGSLFAFEFALINSGVDGMSLRFHYETFNFTYSSPLSIGDDLDSLEANASGLRDDYRADLVVMLTSMDYPNIRGAADGNGAPCVDCAYLITEVQSNFSPTWTLAHELAHLFAADHNRSANVPCVTCGADQDDCRHGWRFTFGGQDRTIMAIAFGDTIAAGAERSLHFSNPEVNFNGFATGTPDDDNARVIANGVCEVSEFHIDPFFGVDVYAPSQVCSEDGDFTAFATVREAAPVYPNHPPPYTYVWSATNATIVGNGASAYVSFSCYSGCTVTVSVTMTAGDGATFSDSRKVEILAEPCFQGGGDDRSADENDNVKHGVKGRIADFEVHPNPATDKITIKLPKDYEGNPVISVFDARGIMIVPSMETNRNSFQLDFSLITAGVYFIQVKDGEGIAVKRIVKN